MLPGDFENDSPNFAKALEVWYPAIAAPSSTPRSLKRFVNHVRYLAMRQRALASSRSWAERLALRLNGQTDEVPSPQSTPIPEEMLVALSTIHHLNPEWLERNDIVSNDPPVLGPPSETSSQEEIELLTALRTCIKKHEQTSEKDEDFNKWPPSEKDRDRLLAILGTIRVH